MAATISTHSSFICQTFTKSTTYPAPSSYFSYFLGKKLPAPLSFSRNRRSVTSAIVKASGAKEQKLVHEGLINQTREQTKCLLGIPYHNSKRAILEDDEDAMNKIKKEIEVAQDNALSLCTEKILLAKQAYDLIDSHIKRLDEDLNQFAEDLKHEGKLPHDEPAILPPLPLVIREEKRKPTGYVNSQSKRYRERDWDREDQELMPPPGSSNMKFIPISIDVDQAIDPNEPTYCVCHQVSFGDMIACDNENVSVLAFIDFVRV